MRGRRMKLKRILAVTACTVLMLSLCVGCGKNKADSSKGNDDVKKVEKLSDAKLLGRTYRSDDGSLWLGLSGTGAEFEFTGDKLSVVLKGSAAEADNAARVGIFVDGNRESDVCLDAAEKTVDISGKGSTPVTVRIVKLSECLSSCCEIVSVDAHGGSIKKTDDKQRRIEFIGDSITCGYGVDDADLSHGFSTATEDCTKSYAYKTAQLLDADHSLVSFSGYGVVSGYTPTGDRASDKLVMPYYDKYGFSESGGFGTKKPSEIQWDFSRFKPDVIVVYLGTNDSSYTVYQQGRDKEYTAEYIGLLKTVRSKNPDAKIICTLGTMGTLLVPAMHEAVSQYSAQTGDNNIATLDLPLQDTQKDGCVIQSHPSAVTHDKAASLLSDKIRSEMGWH